MWNFLKDPWHVKYFAVIFVLLVGLINGFATLGPHNFAGVEGLSYTDGVKAAVFAICTAIFLFIQQIPWWGQQDPVATNRGDKALMALIAVFTVLTGWFWLRDSSGGIAWPFAVILALAASTMVVPAFIHAYISFRTSPSRPAPTPDPDTEPASTRLDDLQTATPVPHREPAASSLNELQAAIVTALSLSQQVVNETYGPAHDDQHPDRTQAQRSWRAARDCRDRLREGGMEAGQIII